MTRFFCCLKICDSARRDTVGKRRTGARRVVILKTRAQLCMTGSSFGQQYMVAGIATNICKLPSPQSLPSYLLSKHIFFLSLLPRSHFPFSTTPFLFTNAYLHPVTTSHLSFPSTVHYRGSRFSQINNWHMGAVASGFFLDLHVFTLSVYRHFEPFLTNSSYKVTHHCLRLGIGNCTVLLGGPSPAPPITRQKYTNIFKKQRKTRFLVLL